MASGGEGRGLGPGQSPVLRIIVENLFYPVTLEVLQQVLFLFFSTFLTPYYVSHVTPRMFDKDQF